MVYDAQNKRDEYYNLKGKSWPNYPYFEPNKYLPKLSYDIQRQPTGANQFFSMGTVQTPELTPSLPPNIWEFDGYGVEGVQNFWRARTTFEESIVKMFVTTTREEFDKAYQDMVDTATKLGLDDATLEEINAAYKELNQQYMSELE